MKKPSVLQHSELLLALRPHQPVLRQAAGFSVLSSLLALTPTIYMFQVYDRVVNSRDHQTLLMLTVLLVGALALMEVLAMVRSSLLVGVARRWDEQLSPRVFQAIHDAHVKRMATGVQPMMDLRTLRDFMGSRVIEAVLDVPLVLVYLMLLFGLSWVAGLLALLLGVLMVGVTWLNERSSTPVLLEANKAALVAQRGVEAAFQQAPVVESMGMMSAIFKRWQVQQNRVLWLQAEASDQAGVYQALSRFIQSVLSSSLLGLGAWLALQGMLTGGVGSIIVGSVLGGKVVSPLVQLLLHWKTVVSARDAWTRLDKMLQSVPAPVSAMPLPAPAGRLQAEQLAAATPQGQQLILRGVSFMLQPGEVLAVVGPSASGKTTLARLLVGVWPTAAGKVRLDGVDVQGWSKAELGPYLGFLPQSVALMEGTLAENIARFGTVNQEAVREAAAAVGLAEHIESLPKGYDTPVGRDGELLSGGMRQRVALARALYGNPALVVLDEPNSSLDEMGEVALANAIKSRKARGCTFVVMTHRTSILSVTDKVLMLRDGVQQAFGPRDEVLASVTRAPAGMAPRPVSALGG